MQIFISLVVYMVFNKYGTISNVLFTTLGNGIADRLSARPFPVPLYV